MESSKEDLATSGTYGFLNHETFFIGKGEGKLKPLRHSRDVNENSIWEDFIVEQTKKICRFFNEYDLFRHHIFSEENCEGLVKMFTELCAKIGREQLKEIFKTFDQLMKNLIGNYEKDNGVANRDKRRALQTAIEMHSGDSLNTCKFNWEEIEDFVHQIKKLNDDNSTLKSTLLETEEAYHQLMQENEDLGRKLNDLQDSNVRHKHLEKQLEEVKMKLLTTEGNYNDLSNTYKNIKTEKACFEEQLKLLTENIQCKINEIEEFKEKELNLIKILNDLKKQNHNILQQNDTFQEELKVKNDYLIESQKRLTDFDEVIKSMRCENRELQEKLKLVIHKYNLLKQFHTYCQINDSFTSDSESVANKENSNMLIEEVSLHVELSEVLPSDKNLENSFCDNSPSKIFRETINDLGLETNHFSIKYLETINSTETVDDGCCDLFDHAHLSELGMCENVSSKDAENRCVQISDQYEMDTLNEEDAFCPEELLMNEHQENNVSNISQCNKHNISPSPFPGPFERDCCKVMDQFIIYEEQKNDNIPVEKDIKNESVSSNFDNTNFDSAHVTASTEYPEFKNKVSIVPSLINNSLGPMKLMSSANIPSPWEMNTVMVDRSFTEQDISNNYMTNNASWSMKCKKYFKKNNKNCAVKSTQLREVLNVKKLALHNLEVYNSDCILSHNVNMPSGTSVLTELEVNINVPEKLSHKVSNEKREFVSRDFHTLTSFELHNEHVDLKQFGPHNSEVPIPFLEVGNSENTVLKNQDCINEQNMCITQVTVDNNTPSKLALVNKVFKSTENFENRNFYTSANFTSAGNSSNELNFLLEANSSSLLFICREIKLLEEFCCYEAACCNPDGHGLRNLILHQCNLIADFLQHFPDNNELYETVRHEFCSSSILRRSKIIADILVKIDPTLIEMTTTSEKQLTTNSLDPNSVKHKLESAHSDLNFEQAENSSELFSNPSINATSFNNVSRKDITMEFLKSNSKSTLPKREYMELHTHHWQTSLKQIFGFIFVILLLFSAFALCLFNTFECNLSQHALQDAQHCAEKILFPYTSLEYSDKPAF